MEAILYVENPATSRIESTGEQLEFPLSEEKIQSIKDFYGIDRSLIGNYLSMSIRNVTHQGCNLDEWLYDLDISDPDMVDQLNDLATALERVDDINKIAAAWSYCNNEIIEDMIDTIDSSDDFVYFPYTGYEDIAKAMLEEYFTDSEIKNIIDYLDCESYVDDYAWGYEITDYGYIADIA